MSKLTTFLILFLFLSQLSAQQAYLDSLRAVFHAEKDPEKKIDLFYEIAFEKALDHPAQGFVYADSIEVMAEKANYQEGLAMVMHLRGYAHRDQGDFDQALHFFREELRIFKELHDREEQGTVYNNLGSLWGDLSQTDSSIFYYLESLAISEELGDKLGASITHNNLGSIYSDEGMYEKAEEHYLKALEVRQELGLEKRFTQCYSNLATLYQRMGQREKAEEYAMKGLALADRYEQTALAGIICNNFGSDLIEQEQYTEALPWTEKAHEYFQALGNELYQVYSLSNLSRAHAGLGNGQLALQMADRGYEIVQRLELDGMKELYFTAYAEAHEANGNYRQALDYWKRYTVITDSLHKLDNAEQVAKMETRFETQKKRSPVGANRARTRKESPSKSVIVIRWHSVILGVVWRIPVPSQPTATAEKTGRT